jgi:hypothetical protein
MQYLKKRKKIDKNNFSKYHIIYISRVHMHEIIKKSNLFIFVNYLKISKLVKFSNFILVQWFYQLFYE